MNSIRPAVRVLHFGVLVLSFVLSSCNSGGGGASSNTVFALNGGAAAGSVNAVKGVASKTYTFNAVADTAYTVSTESSSGNVILQVYNGNPASGGTMIAYSWNGLTTTPYNVVSFIAATNSTIYVTVSDANLTADPNSTGSSYTIQAYSGELSLGSARTAAIYNGYIFYSFEAQAGTAYQVKLAPQTGDANIGSVNAKNTASVGNSLLTGTALDTVTFLAPATQRYYVQATATSTNTTYNIKIDTVTTDPDLSVNIDSAVSNGSTVTVNYTVYNKGLSAAASFNVTGWSDSASVPTVGATGQASATHSGLASGASVSGSFTIANAAASGNAYVIVDTNNLITESVENNNVSAGKAWQKPLLAPQSLTFESGALPAGLTMSGNAAWAIDSTTGGSGSSHSLKSGAITDSQSSCVSMSVANGQSISFDYAVSSEAGYDMLKFYVDGVQSGYFSQSGTVTWTANPSVGVTADNHEYKWCYSKDFSTSAGSDAAWIDNITVIQAPAPTVDLRVAISNAYSNGSSVTINYTVSNSGNTSSGPFNVDLWSSSAGAPALGATGQSTVAVGSLSAGGSTSGTVTVPNVSSSGTAYAIVDTSNVVTESNEGNNISSAFAWSVSIDLSVAINSVISDGNNVTVNYTVSNLAANPAPAFNVDVWSNSASVPTGATAGEGVSSFTGLAAGATTTGAVTVANSATTGNAYAYVDRTNQVAEGNETNNVSAGVAWQTPPSAPLSYNFDNSLIPANMKMSGNAAWVTNTSGKGANMVYSLKAGTIQDSQSSCVAVSAINSSSISFSYSVSSEASYDNLVFYIDGVQNNAWSGSVAWTSTGSISAGTRGLHEFKWCYIKDGSILAGSDTAWIDSIVIN